MTEGNLNHVRNFWYERRKECSEECPDDGEPGRGLFLDRLTLHYVVIVVVDVSEEADVVEVQTDRQEQHENEPERTRVEVHYAEENHYPAQQVKYVEPISVQLSFGILTLLLSRLGLACCSRTGVLSIDATFGVLWLVSLRGSVIW